MCSVCSVCLSVYLSACVYRLRLVRSRRRPGRGRRPPQRAARADAAASAGAVGAAARAPEQPPLPRPLFPQQRRKSRGNTQRWLRMAALALAGVPPASSASCSGCRSKGEGLARPTGRRAFSATRQPVPFVKHRRQVPLLSGGKSHHYSKRSSLSRGPVGADCVQPAQRTGHLGFRFAVMEGAGMRSRAPPGDPLRLERHVRWPGSPCYVSCVYRACTIVVGKRVIVTTRFVTRDHMSRTVCHELREAGSGRSQPSVRGIMQIVARSPVRQPPDNGHRKASAARPYRLFLLVRSATPWTRPRSWGLRTRTWAADGSSAERRRAGRLRRAESSDLRVPARLGGRRDIRSSKTRAEKLRPHGCRETAGAPLAIARSSLPKGMPKRAHRQNFQRLRMARGNIQSARAKSGQIHSVALLHAGSAVTLD
eukprot:COSAG06_NODE_286_length_18312_cov_90.377752_2_plen_424_part_00